MKKKKTIVVYNAQTIQKKIIGLIGQKKAYPLLFQTRFGIHTFGLLFPIDVVILNKNGIIVSVKPALIPNSIFFWNPLYDTVLELPSGTISEKELTIGDEVSVEFHHSNVPQS